MPIRISKIARSLKELGDTQVTELDFLELLNKDIKDLEIARSLRKLGNIKVMEWDFRTVLPAVNKLAQREVDVIGLLKRAAQYKVMEWDFRDAMPGGARQEEAGPLGKTLSAEERQELTIRLKNFLQYVAVNLIDEPKHAQIKVREIEPYVLRFKLVLVKRDVAMLIGREGRTASAIRNVLKTVAMANGVHALLLIHSHEEEAAQANQDPY